MADFDMAGRAADNPSMATLAAGMGFELLSGFSASALLTLAAIVATATVFWLWTQGLNNRETSTHLFCKARRGCLRQWRERRGRCSAARLREATLVCWIASAALMQVAAGVTFPSDKDALAALRDSQDGTVRTALGWMGDPCVDRWKGVECNPQGRVVTLRIGAMQPALAGLIPPQLGNLSSLTVLDLSHNQLSGSIPPQIGNLRSLQILNLGSNQLAGSIPLELGYLPSLSDLNLDSNNLAGAIPPQLGNLASLAALNLRNNKLRGLIPPELGSLRRLQTLNLEGNALSGSMPTWLDKLGGLVLLSLARNTLRGNIPPQIGLLSNLTYLDLSWNSLSSSSIPQQLGDLRNLASLSLESCGLTGPIPAQLGNLSQLTYLSLRDNSLTGPIPPELGKLTGLKTLSLAWNALGGPVPWWLGNLQNLGYLSLSRTTMMGPIPTQLASLRNLVFLDLSENSLVGPIPLGLTSLGNLTTLRLSSNNITGPIPPALFNIPTLTSIELASNNLTGPIPSNALFITTLDLSSNGLSGPLPTNLFLQAPGAKLDLSINSFSGPLPSNLANWPKNSNLANNFLRGTLPAAASNFSIGLNCFNISNGNFYVLGQRDSQACARYYPELSCSCEAPRVVGINGSCYCVKPVRFDAVFTCNNSNSLGNFSTNLQRTMEQLATAFAVAPVQLSPVSFSTQRSSATLVFYILPPGNATELSASQIQSLVQAVGTPGFGSLVAIPNFDVGIAYLTEREVQASPSSSGSTQGTGPPLPNGASVPTPPSSRGPRPRGSKVALISGVLATMVLLVVPAAVLVVCVRPRFLYRPVSVTIEETSVKKWSLADIRAATRNFDETCILGKGGFATVYKGEVGGVVVAVKRLAMKKKGLEAQFVREVQTVGHIHNRNLLRLHGYCIEDNEYLLVYDFMPNGSLEDVLFHRKEANPLPWPTCVKILVGTARAIAYLHEGCSEKIIHRDIKPANILLDSQYVAHVADFGLVRTTLVASTHVSTRVAGTPGYVAPEYALTGQLTEKSDVYSFGVVILAVVANCRPVELSEEKISLVERSFKAAERNALLDLVAPHFHGSYGEDEARRLISVALVCIQPAWQMRPSMGEVVQMLCGKADIPAVDIRMAISVPGFTSTRYMDLSYDTTEDENSTSTLASPCDRECSR